MILDVIVLTASCLKNRWLRFCRAVFVLLVITLRSDLLLLNQCSIKDSLYMFQSLFLTYDTVCFHFERFSSTVWSDYLTLTSLIFPFLFRVQRRLTSKLVFPVKRVRLESVASSSTDLSSACLRVVVCLCKWVFCHCSGLCLPLPVFLLICSSLSLLRSVITESTQDWFSLLHLSSNFDALKI